MKSPLYFVNLHIFLLVKLKATIFCGWLQIHHDDPVRTEPHEAAESFDAVLAMTVTPGFGGQAFMHEVPI